MRKTWEFVRALWFWYVVRAWWDLFPPKTEGQQSYDEGQTLDDD